MTSGGGYTYGYDNNGNTISKTQLSTGDVWTYSYDYENRLTGAVEKSSGGATLEQVTYTYDALGRQIGVDTNGTLRWTVFTGSSADANPYADYTGSGALSMRYLYGPAVDQILARTDPNANTAWYLTDQLGSVWNVVSSSGAVLDAITYDAYGNILNETSPSNGDRFKFAGMQYDATTGIYYDHARYYDPNTGRFVSQDPKGFAAGDANLYEYTTNMPTNFTDPSGCDRYISVWYYPHRYVAVDLWRMDDTTGTWVRTGQQVTYDAQLSSPLMIPAVWWWTKGRLRRQEGIAIPYDYQTISSTAQQDMDLLNQAENLADNGITYNMFYPNCRSTAESLIQVGMPKPTPTYFPNAGLENKYIENDKF